MCFLGCRLFVDFPSVFPVRDKSGLLSAKLWPLKMPTSTAYTCDHTRTHIPISPRFPFFLPRWRATVALMLHILLTSEFSSLGSGLHILSGVFLALVPENTGLFTYKGAFSGGSLVTSSTRVKSLGSPGTPILSTVQLWLRKCILSLPQEENEEIQDPRHQ